MYQPTVWVDETDQYENRFRETVNQDGTVTHVKVRGEVYVQGTPQDAAHFNNLESGVMDAHTASLLMINAIRQVIWRIENLENSKAIEVGTKVLTNSLEFPFNNSKISVPLAEQQTNCDYIVLTSVMTASGNVGEVEVTEKLTNGFKLSYTGSASSVTVRYVVIGGFAE